MSAIRWTMTTLTFAGTAWLLAALSPGVDEARRAVLAPQAVVDAAGPDALLLTAAAAAGWLCWAWGALGLLLTAAAALPGMTGRSAGLLLLVLLPAGARRVAAVAIGLSLVTAAPAAIGRALPAAAPAATATAVVLADRHTDVPGDGTRFEQPGGPPDWPTSPPVPPGPAGERVVLRGDCLWDIAAERLTRLHPGSPVPDAEIARAVHAWWQANAVVIGPDPDRLLPGQVLRPPP